MTDVDKKIAKIEKEIREIDARMAEHPMVEDAERLAELEDQLFWLIERRGW